MRHLALALFLATTSCAAAPVFAQAPQCGDRTTITTDLAEKYGESQQALGLVGPRGVMEFWANDDTGTWTALMSDHLGRSCLIASGQAWELAPAPSAPQGEPV